MLLARQRLPWYLTLGTLAMISAAVGEEWDESWHRSIGRDSFFTPAHVMIYLCGVLAFITGVVLVWQCTFSRSQSLKTQVLRAGSVRFLGLRAPLGVFVAGWGGLAMLTAAPFDNWWHSAYGLDTQLVSPPHVLLVVGLRFVDLGIVLLVVSALNRARGRQPQIPFGNDNQENRQTQITVEHDHQNSPNQRGKLERLLLLIGGLLVAGQMFFSLTYTRDIMLHRASAYEVMGIMLPVALATVAAVSIARWPATIAASLYTAFLLLEIWLLPLFPAQPRLGPVYFPVTHMVPTRFPPLILFPAFVLDLLWQRTRHWPLIPIAIVSGLVFTAVLVTLEWPFATQLMTHLAHSHIFGTAYFSFDARPDRLDRMRRFFLPMSGWPLARGLILAASFASLSSAVGLAFGRWLRTVQR